VNDWMIGAGAEDTTSVLEQDVVLLLRWLLMPIVATCRLNRWTTPRALIRTRFEIVARAILLRIALDLRRRNSLVFLEGSYSYNFDYIGDFSDFRKDCKLLKINGRGERI
jgi:hypothetical protein